MAQKVQKQVKAVTQWSINHDPYIQGCRTIRCDTFLHVGTMGNAPLCNSLYLFLYFTSVPAAENFSGCTAGERGGSAQHFLPRQF